MLASIQTRNEAFFSHKTSGRLGEQQQRIMRLFHGLDAARDYSSKEVAEALHIERSSAVARLNELEALGYLEWAEPRLCRFTGRKVTPLRLPQKQRELF